MKIVFPHLPRYSFKRMLYTFMLGLTPIMLFFGILGAFGVGTVKYNNENVYGIQAFLVALFCTPVISIAFSVIFWLAANFGVLINNALFYKKPH